MPATAFRITARRAQLRHPRPGAIGDLDPEDAVPGPDRDRDRLPGSTRPAMPDTVTKDLAEQGTSQVYRRSITVRIESPGKSRVTRGLGISLLLIRGFGVQVPGSARTSSHRVFSPRLPAAGDARTGRGPHRLVAVAAAS